MNKLLIVEDDPIIMSCLQLSLSPKWEASFARDMTEAKALLAAKTFDALVTDLNFPESAGMGPARLGDLVAKFARELGVPLIILHTSDLFSEVSEIYDRSYIKLDRELIMFLRGDAA